MGSLIWGYIYLLIGFLSIIIGVFIPNSVVGKIVIRSKKVSNSEKYIKRHKITSIFAGIFALFIGFIFFKKGLGYSGLLNIPLLLIIFVGGHYRDKLLIKNHIKSYWTS